MSYETLEYKLPKISTLDKEILINFCQFSGLTENVDQHHFEYHLNGVMEVGEDLLNLR